MGVGEAVEVALLRGNARIWLPRMGARSAAGRAGFAAGLLGAAAAESACLPVAPERAGRDGRMHLPIYSPLFPEHPVSRHGASRRKPGSQLRKYSYY